AAAPHYLESWGDVEIKTGQYSLTQPAIRPLFDTKQFQDALLAWTGSSASYSDYIKSTWNESILGGASYNKALHDGFFVNSSVVEEVAEEAPVDEATETTQTAFSGAAQALVASAKSKGLELSLYTKTGMGDGQQANNPWLQEFPDPISRVSWDNYLTVSKADAEALGLKNRHVADGGLNGS
ncbi:quinol:cytochrome C oxidoreductase, partial [Rhodobacteraceae bacterium B1Z28]|nr:quinol:cytochrome C oxidoreductase [Ruegeria haliotis]